MNINASLFVQMVVFLLGAWVTMKYIWPPLIHAIEERQKKIADGLAAANKGEKALAIVEDAKAQAQVEADRIIESAKAEADVQVQRARDQLRDQVADLAVQGAEQILAREVDKTVHAQLLDQLKAKL